jgi:integrase
VRRDNKSGNAWIYSYRDGWRVFYRVGGLLSGTRVFGTRAEAEETADRIRSEIIMRSRTVRSALDAFEAELRARGLRPSTVARIERDAVRLLRELLDCPLSALTSRRADSIYTNLATSGEYEAGTHQMSLKVAKAFGAWCAHPRRRWLRENPFTGVEKIGKVADHRSESLHVAEAREFREKGLALAECGDVGALAALLALLTSLRPSEITQITARDVDEGGAVLWIDGANLKTANTRRPIEIQDPELRALLARFVDGKAPTDHLVPHAKNFPTRAAQRIAEEIGVPNANARMLRRTFASLAARRGRSLDDLAFSMGHGADERASTARRHYIAPGARETGAAGRVLNVLDTRQADGRRLRARTPRDAAGSKKVRGTRP